MKDKIKNNGYYYIHLPTHPRAVKRPYIAEHVLIMEKHIGRYLKDGEVVHHIDCNRLNNSIENLQLMTQSEHCALHQALKPVKMVEVKCSFCEKCFNTPLRLYKSKIKQGYLNFYCDRKCMGSAQGKIIGKLSKRGKDR